MLEEGARRLVRRGASRQDAEMISLPTIELPAKERLELLRRLDSTHKWGSVREQRFCPCCGELFSGREVDLVGGTRGFGPLRLQCPTRGCSGTPAIWLKARDGKVIEAPAATTKKLSVTHRGRAYTLQRIKRTRPQRAAIARDLRDAAHSAMIRALAATLHLLPAFLQHGRSFVDSRQRPS